MSALLAFLMTALQLGVLAAAYAMEMQGLFADMAVYGAPFYLIMNLFNPGSPLTGGPPVYLAFLLFHAVKYLCLFHARITQALPGLTRAAIGLEILYLTISGYYIY